MNVRVLAVDDAEVVLDTYRLILGENLVETATTVADALAKLERDPSLGVVLADLCMEDGGLPFLEKLHARFPERVMIVISAETAIDPDRLAHLGVLRCLEKGTAGIDEIEAAVEEARARVGARLS